ncbi:MAG: hypothetical protein APR53_03205 [Methanoculleus sp. SDB]|nr:MAG: hypothetical protein APR53_03205 [Methanoculleus sp. SDB]
MHRDTPYADDIDGIVRYITDRSPVDQVGRFIRESGMEKDDFISCPSQFGGNVAAIDGSNAMVLESGSLSFIAVRAAESVFSCGRRERHRISPLRVIRIGPGMTDSGFHDLYAECYNTVPGKPLAIDDLSMAASILRDTVEYWVAIRALECLRRGDCLLLDGALRVSHASHNPLLTGIIRESASRGVGLGAIAKRSALTWGGGYPLVWTVEMLARHHRLVPPWYLRIRDDFPDQRRFDEWRHGDIFVAKFHERAYSAFKVEIPHGMDASAVSGVFSACAAYADDGRIPGYPYPLLDAHRTVAIGRDVIEQVRQDVLRGMNGAGLSFEDYRQWFGDYHDEFERY